MIIKSIAVALAVLLLLLGYLKYKSAGTYLKKIIVIYFLLLLLFSVINSFMILRKNYIQPKEWDFFCFYIDGKVAANHLNFYEPANFKIILEKISAPVKISDGYIEQEANIGFCYPPPTMFVFLPLGFFNYYISHNLWVFIILSFLIVDIFLIWKLFFKKEGMIGLILSSTLLLMLPSVKSAFVFEQTSFITLLLFLLFWIDRINKRNGLWTAIGIFIKPYLAFLYLFQLITRQWKSLLISILAVFIICLITVIYFSPETFYSYFTNNPNMRVPYTYYHDGIFQSLLSTTVKMTHYAEGDISPLKNPFFILPASIVALLALFSSYKLRNNNNKISIIILLLASLLIYPATQTHYSTILIVPVVFLITEYFHNENTFIIVPLFTISIIYFLLQLDSSFSANLFAFLVFVFISFRKLSIIKKGFLAKLF